MNGNCSTVCESIQLHENGIKSIIHKVLFHSCTQRLWIILEIMYKKLTELQNKNDNGYIRTYQQTLWVYYTAVVWLVQLPPPTALMTTWENSGSIVLFFNPSWRISWRKSKKHCRVSKSESCGSAFFMKLMCDCNFSRLTFSCVSHFVFSSSILLFPTTRHTQHITSTNRSAITTTPPTTVPIIMMDVLWATSGIKNAKWKINELVSQYKTAFLARMIVSAPKYHHYRMLHIQYY